MSPTACQWKGIQQAARPRRRKLPLFARLRKVNLKIKQKDLTTDWYNGHKKLLTVNTPEELQPQQRRHGIKQQKSEQNREEEKGANDQKCKLWSSLTYKRQ